MPVARCRSCRLAARISCRTCSTCSPRPRDSIGLTRYSRTCDPPACCFSHRENQADECCPSHVLCATVWPCRFPQREREAASTPVREGDLLWTPSPERVAGARLTEFTRFAEERTGRQFADYAQLWAWSTTELDEFWQAVWDFFDVRSSAPHSAVLASRTMPGARWFPGARLNLAEHVLRNERPGTPALLFADETSGLPELSWEEFAAQVRAVATHLRSRGIGVGDRVVAYLPNIPQAMVAMLATASVGAIWASVSPDFGAARRPGPPRPAGAGRPAGRRRLPLRRPGLRPPRRGRRDRRRPAQPARGRARAGARPRPAGHPVGRRPGRSVGARRGLRVRPGSLRRAAVGAVLLRHHRAAEGDRARSRRDPARAPEAARPAPRPAPRRPGVLLHHHRLDDVELPPHHAAGRGGAGALRRQPQPPRRRRPLADRPGQPGPPLRRQPHVRRAHAEGRRRAEGALRPLARWTS